jgi:hypothetical protein
MEFPTREQIVRGLLTSVSNDDVWKRDVRDVTPCLGLRSG